MKRISAWLTLSVIAVGAILLFVLPDSGTDDDSWAATEQARLEKALLHAEPGSALAFKLQSKLQRLDAWRAGRPPFGFADEFYRVLYEMKIPSDRTTPEYDPGYLLRERAKAPRVRFADKSTVWKSRGPGNVAGRARGIIVDPDDPSGLTWFIAAVGGGVWHTSDGGVNWVELTDDVPNLAIQSLAMAPSNTQIIYAGTGESFFNIDTMNGNGILKSTDKGATWNQLPSTLDDPRFNNVSRILVSPVDPDVVVASATTGTYKAELNLTSNIFRSTDGGASWTVVHTETGPDAYSVPRILQLVADPTDFDIQYATVDGGGILKSTDAGLSWVPINTGITDFTGRFELAVSPVNTDYLFASAEGASHSELWVSWDAGATWNETVESGSEPNWLGAQGWYDNTIVCHPTDARIVYVGGPELYRIRLASIGSTSRTSSPMASYSFPHPDHHGLEIIHPAGGDWFILGTNDGGITRTNVGETGFTMPITGMTTTQFYGVDKRPGASAYVGGMQDNGTWRSPIDPDGVTPWEFQIGGDGYETSWHFNDPQKIIGGYQFNGLQRSTDGGLTWSNATSGLGDTGSSAAPFITKVGKSTRRPDDIFAVGASGVWYSTDFGASWHPSAINSGDWGGLSAFLDVRVSEADPDVVWAGSRMDDTGDLMVSTDGGLSFDGVSDYTDVTMGRISGLAADPHDAQTAYALFSYAGRPKVLKTTDLGASWTDISGFGSGSTSGTGFPDVAVYDLMVFPNDPSRIWVGSEIGLIESSDGGATWALADNGLPAVGIWKLSAIEDEVVLATHGRGIWTMTDPALLGGSSYAPLFEVAVQQPAGGLHLEFNLRSAYDSTQVWIDGEVAETIAANTPLQIETFDLPVLSAGTRTIFARSHIGGETIDSITRQVEVMVFGTPVFDYANDLDAAVDAEDFQRTGFTWAQPSGFGDGALHTAHDYPDGETAIAMLLKPIYVSQLSTLSFDEVAIVEPGDAGTVFGDGGFWDYVVVEGSLDGVTWLPLADGWDARDDSAWLNAYYANGNGSSSLYRGRSIVINDTFDPGQAILLRFRLFADNYVNAWGWAIDDIVITSEGLASTGDTPVRVSLSQNYPNPFNPSTTIAFSMRRAGPVKLQVFDIRGRVVRTLIDGHREAGEYRQEWDGRDTRGAEVSAGVYLYRLEADGMTLQRKMSLLK